MQCPSCGGEIQVHGAYCPKCGARIDDPANAALASHPADHPTEPQIAMMPSGRRDAPEQDLWVGRYSSGDMIGNWLLCGAITIGLIVVGSMWASNGMQWLGLVGTIAAVWLFNFALLMQRKLSVSYRLTNQRLFHEHGLLWRVVDRIELVHIEDLTLKQGPIDRMMGVGAILIHSAERTDATLLLKGIADVRNVFDKIDKARRAEALRRSLRLDTDSADIGLHHG